MGLEQWGSLLSRLGLSLEEIASVSDSPVNSHVSVCAEENEGPGVSSEPLVPAIVPSRGATVGMKVSPV